jgi:transcription elongation factor Elf1
MTIARLKLAFTFDCPNCGKRNTASSVIHEFTAEEAEKYSERMGFLPHVGDVVGRPDEVTCEHCQTTFQALCEHEDDQD